MLGSSNVMATLAVTDLARARAFYGDLLGFEEAGSRDDSEMAIYRSGDARFLVYRSQYAGTNQATGATWGVGDELDAIAAALSQAGVVFEHYDWPGVRLNGDIHEMGEIRGVWLKDPDGNILHINDS